MDTWNEKWTIIQDNQAANIEIGKNPSQRQIYKTLFSIPFSRLVPELGTFYLVSIIGTMIKTIHSKEYQTLTNWLKVTRIAQGLTMRDLALKLEVPHSFIGKVEQCERRIDVIEYIHYCKALEVSPVEGFQLLLS